MKMQDLLPPLLFRFLKHHAPPWLRKGGHRESIHLAHTPERPLAKSPYAFPISGENPLEALGEKWKPTKRLHNYLPHYWAHFRDIRHAVRHVIEIGVQSECSVRMWEEFFPNATIYGLDIDPACQSHEGGRVRIRIGDQSDPAFLRSVLAEMDGAPDIVIDDGSHKPNHQIATFNVLFPNLSEHGLYVIEDTGGVVNDPQLQTVNEMKSLVDHVMYWPTSFPPPGLAAPPYLRRVRLLDRSACHRRGILPLDLLCVPGTESGRQPVSDAEGRSRQGIVSGSVIHPVPLPMRPPSPFRRCVAGRGGCSIRGIARQEVKGSPSESVYINIGRPRRDDHVDEKGRMQIRD